MGVDVQEKDVCVSVSGRVWMMSAPQVVDGEWRRLRCRPVLQQPSSVSA